MTRDHGLTRYKHGPDEHGNPGKGCRCARCREACAGYDSRRSRLIAYGRWEYPVDAAGTRRRLQALTFNGWSLTALAGRYGCTLKAVRKMLAYERVSVATAAAVRALYDELWDEPPPEGTPFERRAGRWPAGMRGLAGGCRRWRGMTMRSMTLPLFPSPDGTRSSALVDQRRTV